MKFSLITFFLFIFLASFFYEDPFSVLSKRIFYSIFLYLTLYQLYLFRVWKMENEKFIQKYNALKLYNIFFVSILGIILISDFVSPRLNFVTLFNNPNGFMLAVPFFAFEVGIFTRDISKLFNLFLKISLAFFIVCFIPFRLNVKIYEANICAYVMLPLSIFFFAKKKYLPYCVVMIVSLVIFSFYSDIRTIFLRIILFLCLAISLTMVKKSGTAKILIILVVAFVISQAIANFQFYLDLFAQLAHIKKFDSDDTRTFLYEELFQDTNLKQFIIGKGFLGTYFSPYFLMVQQSGDPSGDVINRFSSEVGFLQLLLKGGFSLYVLYTLPLLYAAIKGIMKAYNNKLIFLLSIFLLNEVFLMFFENSVMFTFNFFILFFIAGYIVSKVNPLSKTSGNKIKKLPFLKEKPLELNPY